MKVGVMMKITVKKDMFSPEFRLDNFSGEFRCSHVNYQITTDDDGVYVWCDDCDYMDDDTAIKLVEWAKEPLVEV